MGEAGEVVGCGTFDFIQKHDIETLCPEKYQNCLKNYEDSVRKKVRVQTLDTESILCCIQL